MKKILLFALVTCSVACQHREVAPSATAPLEAAVQRDPQALDLPADVYLICEGVPGTNGPVKVVGIKDMVRGSADIWVKFSAGGREQVQFYSGLLKDANQRPLRHSGVDVFVKMPADTSYHIGMNNEEDGNSTMSLRSGERGFAGARVNVSMALQSRRGIFEFKRCGWSAPATAY